MTSKKKKALVLFSGGLDSILVVEILRKQGVSVSGIVFSSYFLSPEQAKTSAKAINLELEVIDISEEQLEVTRNPKYGYGSSMNPCLDCRILMLKKAKAYAKKKSFDIIATGEVVGQRPMTQNKKALGIVEKEAGLLKNVLRPLSAKLLPETIYEEKGIIKRENPLDISGRSRKRQMKLAEELGIKNYPLPAGGCLLTELEFGKKLKKLFNQCQRCEKKDILLLKVGRHFWPFEDLKIEVVVGRNKDDNLTIKGLAKKGDILIEMVNYPGPMTLIRNYGKGEIPEKIISKTKSLTKYYSLRSRQRNDVDFNILKK